MLQVERLILHAIAALAVVAVIMLVGIGVALAGDDAPYSLPQAERDMVLREAERYRDAASEWGHLHHGLYSWRCSGRICRAMGEARSQTIEDWRSLSADRP